jgi:hypothetical protein
MLDQTVYNGRHRLRYSIGNRRDGLKLRPWSSKVRNYWASSLNFTYLIPMSFMTNVGSNRDLMSLKHVKKIQLLGPKSSVWKLDFYPWKSELDWNLWGYVGKPLRPVITCPSTVLILIINLSATNETLGKRYYPPEYGFGTFSEKLRDSTPYVWQIGWIHLRKRSSEVIISSQPIGVLLAEQANFSLENRYDVRWFGFR